MSEAQIMDIRTTEKETIEAELKIGFDSKPVVATIQQELADVYAPLRTTA